MAKPDDSKPSEPAETIDEFFAKVGQHLGPAPTREEKLAALCLYVSEEEAREIMSESDILDIADLVEAAPTRDAKLAVLREYYTEDEAQQEIHFFDLEPFLVAAPTREEKLTILRRHFSEETVQARLRYIMDKSNDTSG